MVSYTLILPFSLPFVNAPNLECGLGYYVTVLILGLGALLVYVIVTRRYKRRERQLIGNEQQMIESYYERMVTMNVEEEHVHIKVQESGGVTSIVSISN